MLCALLISSFRIRQKFLNDQGRWLQPPLHSSGSHGHCILWVGIYNLAGKAIKKRYVSLTLYENKTTLKWKKDKETHRKLSAVDSSEAGAKFCVL